MSTDSSSAERRPPDLRARALTRNLVLALLAACHTADEGPPRIEGGVVTEGDQKWLEYLVDDELPAPPPPMVVDPTDEMITGVRELPELPEPEYPELIHDKGVYSLELRRSELGHALRMLAEMSRMNLLLDGDFSTPVDISIPGARMQPILETLLSTYACQVEIQGEIIVVRRDDPSDTRSRIYSLDSIPAALVQDQLQLIVGEEGLVVNPSRNVVMVTGSPSELAQVDMYLETVDRPDRQVLIEARIVEISRSDLEDLGTRLAYDDIPIDDWTASFVADLLNPVSSVIGTASNADGDIDFALTALRELLDLQVVSRPRMVTLNNAEARLVIVTEVPYVDATTTTEASGASISGQTIESIEFKNIGLELTVTPSIQESGLVSMTVDQRISEQTGVFQNIPIVDSREIKTSFVVREGETIMIGGISRNLRREVSTGVPLLADIPGLGKLFRRDIDDREQLEMFVLMTPRLIDPYTAAEIKREATIRLPAR